MNDVLSTDRTMGKKKGARPPEAPPRPPPERIEFQASAGWTAAIDAAAAKEGMNRSAYIRHCIIERMRAQGLTPPVYSL